MSSVVPRRLVVGLDFGTTFSGVAYAQVEDSSPPDIRDISVISQWRGSGSSTYELVKVPTKISYDKDDKVTWGYEVRDNTEPIELIKLLLLREDDLKRYLQSQDTTDIEQSRDRIISRGKSVATVISDYLRHLWQYAWGQMKAEVGEVLGTLPIHVVLTVPAIWPEYARKSMKEAAENAGICADRVCRNVQIELVSEPEAAMISVLYGRGQVLKPGMKMVVVDLGGGTADVISYMIEQTKPFLKFRECVEGAGGLYGGKLPDRAFENYLEKYIGPERWQKCSQLRELILRESWENRIKHDFDNSNPGKLWLVDTILSGEYSLRNEQIARCFDDTVIPGIKELVKKQIQGIEHQDGTRPDYIALVGGFGRSPYVYQMLRGGLGREYHIDVLQPKGSSCWSAVALGAVLSGCVQPDSRVARHSYGWSTNEPFDPKHHKIEDRYWDDGSSAYMARNQVVWPIRRGQEVKSSDNSYKYSLKFRPGSKGPYVHKENFYKSTRSEPPARISKTAEYTVDEVIEGVQYLGQIELKTPVNIEDLPVITNTKGQFVPVLEWDWNIHVSGNSIDMVANTPDGAYEVGRLTIQDGMQ